MIMLVNKHQNQQQNTRILSQMMIFLIRIMVTILFISSIIINLSSQLSSSSLLLFVSAQTTTPPPAPPPRHIGLDNTSRMILYTTSYLAVSFPTLYFAPTAAFTVMRGVRLDLFLCRGGVRPTDEVGIGFFPSTFAPTLKIGDTTKPGAETRGAIVIYLACVGVACLAAILRPKWSKDTGREDWTVPPQLQQQMDELHRQRVRGCEEELEREIERLRARSTRLSRSDISNNNNNNDKKSKKKNINNKNKRTIDGDDEEEQQQILEREIQRARDRLINNNPLVQNPPEVPASLPNTPQRPVPLFSYVGLVYAQFICPWAMCAGFLFGVNETLGQALSIIPFVIVLLFFLGFLFKLIKLTETPSSRSLRVAPSIIVRPRPTIEQCTEDTLRIERLFKSTVGQFCLLPESNWEVPVAAQAEAVSFWNNSRMLFRQFWGPFETCAAILNPSGGPIVTDSVQRIFSRHFFTISAGVAIAVCIMQGHGAIDRAFCRDYGRMAVMIVNCLYCVAFLLLRPYLLPLHNVVLGTIEVLIMFSSIAVAVGIEDLDSDKILEGSSTTFMVLEILLGVVCTIGGLVILIFGFLSNIYLDKSKLKILNPTKRHLQMSRETSMSFLSVNSLGSMMDEEMDNVRSGGKTNGNNNNDNDNGDHLHIDDYLNGDSLLGGPRGNNNSTTGKGSGKKSRKDKSKKRSSGGDDDDDDEGGSQENFFSNRQSYRTAAAVSPSSVLSASLLTSKSQSTSQQQQRDYYSPPPQIGGHSNNSVGIDIPPIPQAAPSSSSFSETPFSLSSSRRVRFSSDVIEKDEMMMMSASTGEGNNNRKDKKEKKHKKDKKEKKDDKFNEDTTTASAPLLKQATSHETKDAAATAAVSAEMMNKKWINPKSKFVVKADPVSFAQQLEEVLRPASDLLIINPADEADRKHQSGDAGYKKLKRLDEPQNVIVLTKELKRLLDPNSNNSDDDDHGNYGDDQQHLLFSEAQQQQQHRLRQFYNHYAPHKSDRDIIRVLKAWEGQFDEMWQELTAMYGPEQEQTSTIIDIPETSSSATSSPLNTATRSNHHVSFHVAPTTVTDDDSLDFNNSNGTSGQHPHQQNQISLVDNLKAQRVEIENQQLRSRLDQIERELFQMKSYQQQQQQQRTKTPSNSMDRVLAAAIPSSSPSPKSAHAFFNNNNNNNDSFFSSASSPSASGSATPQTAIMNGLSIPDQNVSNNTLYTTRGASLSAVLGENKNNKFAGAASNQSDKQQERNQKQHVPSRSSFSLDSIVSSQDDDETEENLDGEDLSPEEMKKYLLPHHHPHHQSNEGKDDDDNDDNGDDEVDLDRYFAAVSGNDEDNEEELLLLRHSNPQQDPQSVSSPAFVIPDYTEFENQSRKEPKRFVLDEDESENIDYELPAKAIRTLRQNFSWNDKFF